MKKFKLFLSIFAVLLLFTGCSKKDDNKEIDNLEGGWNTVADTVYKSGISKKAKEAFDKATEEYTGMDLEVVGLLGTQVVSGTNYMYLAKGTTVTPDATADWKIVVVYVDLKGKATVNSVEDFDYTKYTNTDIQYEESEVTGGWTVNSKEVEVEITEESNKVYEDATKEFTGSKLSPIAYLGNQVVAGTNYAYLTLATTTTKNPVSYIAVVTVNKDLSDETSIVSVSYVDLASLLN